MRSLNVVSDASAIIALNDIGLLDQLSPLFTSCTIPPAVAREIAPSVRLPGWITTRILTRPIDQRVLAAALDPGETEVLSLALELDHVGVVLDERSARRVGLSLGLPITGTVGILITARQQTLIPKLRPILEALRLVDFYMSEELVATALKLVGETTEQFP